MPSSFPARSGPCPARRWAVACLALAVLTFPAAAQETPASPATPLAAPAAPEAATPSAPAVPATPASPVAPAVPAAPEAGTASAVPGQTPPSVVTPSPTGSGEAAPAVALPDGPTTEPRLSLESPDTNGAAQDVSADAAPEAAGRAGLGATLPHDLTPLGMFMAADIVVKAVMLGLAFASVVTWTIWLAKALELAMARRRATRALRRLERAEGLSEISGERDKGWPKRGPVAALAAAAALEIARSQHLPTDGVKERVQIALQRIEARAGRSMSRGTGLLATIGSTAPFVGLFGTVWGIMNAFIGISRANTTNLAVVAPGIAEALLATAIGLVAAIPAVIIYNVFARSIAGYRAVLADASAEVLRHLSRDLDRRERFVASERRQAAE
ncbi:tonB-system energizer ExbB [Aureimonas glaciei]|uniref:Biopolymer transport protein ExbB n=1 Tax=Aureimonas glaciei TaxID=1776957 RepID=A0A916Y683_9HYPH|nr:tonB-system energizer ExbB [Aureimonas glaciei]GGD33145.1 tonB-system energizer ExbB [Aureimonas glaciei]